MDETTHAIASAIPLVFTLLGVVALVLGIRYSRRRHAPPRQPLPAAPVPEYPGPFAFVRRHYNGDYALGRSYWVNTLIVSLVAPGLGLLLLALVGDRLTARHGSAAVLLLTALGFVCWYWAIRGTWASSNKHVRRGGRAGWAAAAKVVILLGVFKNAMDVVKLAPSLAEHVRVAAGEQSGPPTTFELRTDGKSLLLAGGFNDGTADALESRLAASPGVTTVVLTSPGGWVREGRLVAAVIRQRGLNTYVERYCASACTVAFLAGKERAAAPDAKIGFHASRAVGSMEEMAKAQSSPDLRDLYRTAGIDDAFVRRALDTSHDSLWTPSHAEMLQAGVLTRKSAGGETAALATRAPTREALAAELKKVELLAALARRSPPADFERILDASWRRVQQGATDAQVIVAARAEIIPVVQRMLPLASDAALVEHSALLQAQMDVLRQTDAGACVDVMFPRAEARSLIYLLPPDLRAREMALLVRVVTEADPSRAFRPSPDELRRAAQRASRRLTPDQLRIFADDAVRLATPPEQTCAASRAFYAEINAIPLVERGKLLRTLVAAI